MTDLDYRVYIIALPGTVRAAVRIDSDGFASIYINASLSMAEQAKAFKHEMRHLRRGDMFNFRSIRQIERRERRCSKKSLSRY